MNIGGYITRGNLATPLANLDIQVDPFWLLTGDNSNAADASSGDGIELGLSATKYVWADSPFVAGKIPVLATPDNAELKLRLLIDGTSMDDARAKAAEIAVAITQQLTYEISVSYDVGGSGETTLTWTCFPGQYEIAINQMYLFGNLLPMYISVLRYPIPVAGGL